MSINYHFINQRLRETRRELRLLASAPVHGPGADIIYADLLSDGLEKGKGKDLLITPNEVNWHHGTGVLLNRLFSPEQVINLRSHEDYADKGPFTSFVIKAQARTRSEVFAMTMQGLARQNIRRILCVPYYPEDYLIGIAAKNILGVPMAVWVMDDRIIHQRLVKTSLASELFALADVRFVISPEMRDAYESRVQQKFYMLPPTVGERFISENPSPDFQANLEAKTCSMLSARSANPGTFLAKNGYCRKLKKAILWRL